MESPPRHALRLGTLLALTSAIASCEVLQDLTDQGGNSERGFFRYAPAADVAVAGTLSLTLYDHETLATGDRGLELADPSSSDPDVLELEEHRGEGSLRLVGQSAGEARIEFEALADGTRRTDALALRVRRATKLELSGCERPLLALRDTDLQVHYRFNPDGKRPLLGLGVYPFELEPSDGLEFAPAASDLESFAFHVPSTAPESVIIRSNLPDDDEALTVEVIEPEQVDGVALAPAGGSTGQSLQVDLRPRAQGRTLCGTFPRVLRSLTPTICGVAGEAGGSHAHVTTQGQFAYVQLVSAGVCQLALEIPALGHTLRFAAIRVQAVQTPNAGGRDDDQLDGEGFDWD